MGKVKEGNFNYQMCILSAIGMIAVILGHIENTTGALMTLDGWFPYYSYHLPLFIFISGYFYKQEEELHVGRFILKKIRTMIIPFYLVNGGFYLFQSFLRVFGFSIGDTFSMKTWLLNPWKYTQPLSFAIPSWYLIAIFLTELVYILLRKFLSYILGKEERLKESLLLLLSFIFGIISVIYVQRKNPEQLQVVYLRSVIMIFFFEYGYIYKKYLEERARCIPDILYFTVVFIAQGIMLVLLHGKLDSGLWGVKNGFDWHGITFYIEGIIGVAFWLRLSEWIAMIPKQFKLLVFIGKNTKWIMSFHLFGFFIMNTIIYLMLRTNNGMNLLRAIFDTGKYKSQIYYCISNKQLGIIYLFSGVGVTYLLIKIGQFFKHFWWRGKYHLIA